MQNKAFDVGPDILFSKYTAGIESYDVVLVLIKPAKESTHTIKQATHIHYEQQSYEKKILHKMLLNHTQQHNKKIDQSNLYLLFKWKK